MTKKKNPRGKIKRVVLPSEMEEQAMHFGEVHAEISCHPFGSPEYKDAYGRGFYRFCHEAYTHSMTPSGNLGANPSTPRISKNNYDVMLNWVDDLGKKKGFTKKQITDSKAQIRTAITILAHQYLNLMTSIQVKSGKGKNATKSDLVYKKNVDTKTPYENMIGHMEVEKRRFVRLFVASMISAFLDFLFRVSNFEMGKTLISKYLNPVFAKPEQLGLTTERNIGSHLKKLKTKDFRAKFIQAVKNDVFDTLKSSNKKFVIQVISRKRIVSKK